ncbi:unnamed protein product, partial [marine sediment metagenome]
KRPITCWVTHNKETGEWAVIDGVTEKVIGYGVPVPSEGLSVSGFHKVGYEDPWKNFRENADYWFKKFDLETESLSFPAKTLLQNRIETNRVPFFYVLAHGAHTQFTLGNEIHVQVEDIMTWMKNRKKMVFAFVGHCQGMYHVGDRSFSGAYRKGSMEDTVSVGYIGMGNCKGWPDAIPWQHKMFSFIKQGQTFKNAFDMATALYPRIESGVRFVGDEKLKLGGENMEVIEMNFVLERKENKYSIFGVVSDKEGEAISDALLQLDPDGQSSTSKRTNVKGHYLFQELDFVGGSVHKMRCIKAGYVQQEKTFTVE